MRMWGAGERRLAARTGCGAACRGCATPREVGRKNGVWWRRLRGWPARSLRNRDAVQCGAVGEVMGQDREG